MKRVVHRLSITSLLFLIGMLAMPFSFVTAQESSPTAAPGSLLADLGLPVLEVTVTADAIAAPAEVPAGPVLLVANNQTDLGLTVDLAQLPESATVDDYIGLASEDDGFIPEWVADLVLAGYAWADPGASGSIVLNLAPGDWSIIADADVSETDGVLAQTSIPLTVTGEQPAGTAIAAGLDVEFGEYAFNFPDTVTAGPQIWHVSNTHTSPHHAVIFPVDRLYTADEVHDGFMAGFSGTPAAAGGFSEETSIVGPPFDLPVITGGQEYWTEVDLAPGFYLAICFIADPGSDVPHLMQGMIDAFEVTAS